MIACIKDVNGGADISASVERKGFSVEATFGSRMDVLKMQIHDPDLLFALPDRREIVIYDALAPWEGGSGEVCDPPYAVSAYNTFLHGPGHEVVSEVPADWTPRFFGGFLASPVYSLDGPERNISVQAQDYTYRLRSTVCNIAFEGGLSDQTIVKTLFKTYRRDFNTDNVNSTVNLMPAISFPVHSLEQFMQRVTKISRAVYRVDYYKRLWYGLIGQHLAPFNLAESPDAVSSFGYENAAYGPDASGLSDRVWIVGRDYQSALQTYQIPVVLVTGAGPPNAYQFSLPGSATKADIKTVQIGAGPIWTVAGGNIGQAPTAGDITDQASFKNDVIVQPTPPTIAFKVTPPAGSVIVIVGRFRYPLIQIYTDAALVHDAGGVFFEAVVRDKRIRDLVLAQQVGKTFLANQGITLKGMSATVYQRQLNGILLSPGQTLDVDAPRLFAGLGENPKTFLVSRTTTTLDDANDLDHPYRVEVELADHTNTGGQ